jgi:hypothetical protein
MMEFAMRSFADMIAAYDAARKNYESGSLKLRQHTMGFFLWTASITVVAT